MKYSLPLILLVVLLVALVASVVYNLSTQGLLAFETLFSVGMTVGMGLLVWYVWSRSRKPNDRS